MFNDENAKTETWVKIAIGAFLFYIFVIPLISRFWGKEEIGSFFEAPRPYNARYYVNLFPDGEKSKNYKMPADLTVDEMCENDGDGNSGCYRLILLDKAYFSNGGSVSFDDCHLEEEKPSCFDDDGKYWKIEFNKEKVK